MQNPAKTSFASTTGAYSKQEPSTATYQANDTFASKGVIIPALCLFLDSRSCRVRLRTSWVRLEADKNCSREAICGRAVGYASTLPRGLRVMEIYDMVGFG